MLICYYFRKRNEDNQSVWNHLRGMNGAFISKPDLRFYCTGDYFSARNNLLTVTEVFAIYIYFIGPDEI